MSIDCSLLRWLLVAVLSTGLGVNLPTPAAAGQVLQVKASSGAKLRTLLSGNPETAKANVILLTGGNGVLKISGKGEIRKPTDNFLVRTRELFVAAGFLAALVDAPMDRRAKPGLLGGFRASAEHGADLATIARDLNNLNGRPVVVVGTSRGTVSAVNLALRETGGVVAGAVLTSSITRPNKKGGTIRDLPLGRLKVPLLFVHNKGDKCKTTRLSGIAPIVDMLKQKGVKAELVVVASTRKTGKNCRGRSPHGFLGLEAQVIKTITVWIEALL